MDTIKSETPVANNLFRTVLILTLTRVVINMMRRFTYPFVPALSREFGVPMSSIQSVTALQAGIGVTSPLFGTLSERYGRRKVMIGALILMASVAGAAALLPRFGMFSVMLVLFGIGKMIFDPATQAYIGDHVPYHQRGKIIGILELSWAASLIISAPLVGWLLEVSTLRVVFAVFGVLLVSVAVLLAWGLPPDVAPTAGKVSEVVTPWQAVMRVWRFVPARAALFYGVTVTFANEILLINYGAFMENSFMLSLAALGSVTTVIAVAEVCGELVIIGWINRIGARRLVLVGAFFASCLYVVLPHLTGHLTVALIGVFVLFVAAETALVAAIPIYSELMPESRAVMLSASAGAAAAGRLIGSFTGSILFTFTQSFALLGVISMIVGLLGVLIFWRYVRV